MAWRGILGTFLNISEDEDGRSPRRFAMVGALKNSGPYSP